MRCPLPSVVLALAGSSFAQVPILHANEVAAHRQAQQWVQQPVNQPVQLTAGLAAYDWRVFGSDGHGSPAIDHNRRGQDNGLDPLATAVLLLTPQRGAQNAGRMLFANRGGRIFVGEPPTDPTGRWQPTVETFAAPGVPATLNNMLLDSGIAQDGTRWQRLEALEAAPAREQQVRLVHDGATGKEKSLVEIGASRLPWHPAWLPLGDVTVVSMRAPASAAGQPDGQSLATGTGVPARDLHLHVTFGKRSAVLTANDVSIDGGELRVAIREDALVDDTWLYDQAWAANGLRLLAGAELAFRTANSLDRDGDGKGEFGTPATVMPRNQGDFQTLPNGRFLFRNHLFEFHLANDPDTAELHFVAYGWPAVARGNHDLAFFVDERGIVHRCAATGRFAGHDQAPAADSRTHADLGWTPLRRAAPTAR